MIDKNIILGIETCTNICSVALWDGQTLHETVNTTPRSHSRCLIPMIETLLSRSGQSIKAIQAVACARGPGSFTGVRIGVGVAKGIAFGRDIAILPVSPLQAVAYQVMCAEKAEAVSVIMDARMGELYAADYINQHGLPVQQGEERLITIDQVNNHGQVVAGTGVEEYQDALTEKRLNCSTVIYPKASALVELARQQQITPVKATDFAPVYLRNKVTD